MLRVAVSAVALALVVSACGGPKITFGANTPDDLRGLVGDVWDRFREAFPATEDCVGEVRLQGDWDLREQGEYRALTGTITVGIPGPPSRLSHTVVHELAHHLEAVCPTQWELREPFLVAQGYPPDTDWFEAATWEEIPSEQFAEAVVQVVLGRPAVHYRIELRPEAVELVRQWGLTGQT